jgi:ATP-binding cassette subfamily A (ABC1) protein 3
VNHLAKKYNNGYVAIRDISLSVKAGEIFGLLGPNGAGKSTTFNIVTAALPKTSGVVRILNEDINNGIMDIFEEFGVCPQYDSIYEGMTTEEHIRYAARLKGVKEESIDELANYYYELLSLTPYVKVKAGNLSGGNKRKLCVSMAMLANPKIMFFDEPSSGVDPISRRFLWKSLCLSARSKGACMILTTHTMSEA